MSPVNHKTLEEGELVQHLKAGYVGRFFGVTEMEKVFELPSDDIGIRVRVTPTPEADEEIRVASPTLLMLISEMTLEERHKAHLAFLGIENKGIQMGSKSPGKRPKKVCWNCKKKLGTEENPECLACGWMLCNCGACGCGWSIK